MYMRYTDLGLTIVEKPSEKYHGGYKYLITNSAYGYAAFKTDEGFKAFLKQTNLKKEFISERRTPECGLLQFYRLHGVIEEYLFWNLSELPQGVTRFTGLSNGSLVDCYYLHTENGSMIFRPNSNALEVYKPLPLAEHIAFMRLNG